MSLPISSLTTIAKTSISTTHYLPLAAGSSSNFKLLVQDLFPTFNTVGTGSETLYTSITNKNTLNFKGIKAVNNLISVVTSNNNIELSVNEDLINLANCDNTTSQFLSSPVDLTAEVTGTMPIANGGTGAASFTANSLLLGNGTSALSALGAATNGQIPIGRTGLNPVLANITAGTNVTVTNGAGSITIAASLTTLTANLNGNNYNIYGLGWLSGDGQAEGIKIDSSGKVFVGSSTPTAFYTYDLNVNNGIAVNGANAQYIKATNVSSPQPLYLLGSDSSASGAAGGAISMKAGDGLGSGNGGSFSILGGQGGATGSGGNITIAGGYNTAGNAGNIYINGGETDGASTPGSVAITAGSNSAGTLGNVGIHAEKTTIATNSAAGAAINFTGATATDSSAVVSTSTGTTGTKTGAIQVEINGVKAWIRVYSTAE